MLCGVIAVTFIFFVLLLAGTLGWVKFRAKARTLRTEHRLAMWKLKLRHINAGKHHDLQTLALQQADELLRNAAQVSISSISIFHPN